MNPQGHLTLHMELMSVPRNSSFHTDFSKFEDCIIVNSFILEYVVNGTFLSNNAMAGLNSHQLNLPILMRVARKSTVWFTFTYGLLLERKAKLL